MLFSILRDTVGKDFTLQEVNTYQPAKLFDNIVYLYLQVFYGWRKVTQEFLKRMDPSLPFYYHTSTNTRFYEGVMPEFDKKPAKKHQPKRIPKYELLGTSERITMAVRGATSVRTQFHNVPLELPLHQEYITYSPMNIHIVILHLQNDNTYQVKVLRQRITVRNQSPFLVTLIPAYHPGCLK